MLHSALCSLPRKCLNIGHFNNVNSVFFLLKKCPVGYTFPPLIYTLVNYRYICVYLYLSTFVHWNKVYCGFCLPESVGWDKVFPPPPLPRDLVRCSVHQHFSLLGAVQILRCHFWGSLQIISNLATKTNNMQHNVAASGSASKRHKRLYDRV